MSYKNWESNVPFPARDRSQINFLNNIASCLDAGVKIVAGQAGTGVGKSFVAITLARSAPKKAYILTTTRFLTEQYKDKLGNWIVNITGKANYHLSSCSDHRQKFLNCEKGSDICHNWIVSTRPKKEEEDEDELPCAYQAAKKAAKKAHVTGSTVSYWLKAIAGNEKWPLGDLLIIDEFDGVPSFVLDLVTTSISSTMLNKYDITFSIWEEAPFNIADLNRGKKNHIPLKKETALRGLNELLNQVNEKIEKYNQSLDDANEELTRNRNLLAGTRASEDPEGEEVKQQKIQSLQDKIEYIGEKISELKAEIEGLSELFEKLKVAVDNIKSEPWSHEITAEKKGDKLFYEFICKPVALEKYVKQLIFRGAKQFVLLSATLGAEKYFHEMIGTTDFAWVEEESPFLAERRPIYAPNFFNISRRTPHLNEVVKQVQRIVDSRKTKGIIHCTSNDMVHTLEKTLKGDRFIWSKAGESQNAVKLHKDSKEPTVLVACNLSTGVSLDDELARFMVITKIPYAYMGDDWVQKRMRYYPGWYKRDAGRTLEQMLGRGFRSMADWCEVFVLDGKIQDVLEHYPFPKNITNAIKGLEAYEQAIENPSAFEYRISNVIPLKRPL